MSRQSAPFVIYISVDGLRSGDATADLQTLIDAGLLPGFARLQAQGAWTHDARTDPFHTNTIPNHSTMLTGRPVEDATGVPGHRYRNNTDTDEFPDVPVPGVNLSTLHTSAIEYIPSVFNVAHDRGYSTAVYASKTKFSLYDDSYDGVDGAGDPAYETTAPAQDTVGEDNGLDKLDRYFQDGDVVKVIDRLVADAANGGLSDFSFVHIRYPDSAGHDLGWGSPEYLQGIRDSDAQLQRIFALIDGNAAYSGNTYLILTADHGGGGDQPVTDTNHANPLSPVNFTIPFYVWGPDVAGGADLYALNPQRRVEPAADVNPNQVAVDRPIRNGDGGNLALDLLGLPAIPTSTLNQPQDLNPFVTAGRFGTAGVDALVGGAGRDNLHGEAGNDRLAGSLGHDNLEGGSGNDLLFGGVGDDRLNGGDGLDLASYAGAAVGVAVDLRIRDAQDTLGAGIDRLIAVESLFGSSLADTLRGDAFANGLVGGAGDDVLSGMAGLDMLDGGAGADLMLGGLNNDLYVVDDAGDVVSEAGGGGQDMVRALIDYALPNGVENLTLSGGSLGRGNDGRNTLIGSVRDERLEGLGGTDTLIGGGGRDVLVGGAGGDTFVFNRTTDSRSGVPLSDRIVDFSRAQGDKVLLRGIDADTTTAGDQAFSFIGAAGITPGAPGQLRAYFNGTLGLTVIQGEVNGDGAVDFQVLVENVTVMITTDFVL